MTLQKTTNGVCDEGVCVGFNPLADVAVDAEASLCDFANDDGSDGQKSCDADKNEGVVKEQACGDESDHAYFRENQKAADHKDIGEQDGPQY